VNQGNEKDRIAVAEGPETALSIREAHPEWRVYATLGISQFGRVPLAPGIKEVLICADNDGDKPQIKKMLDRAVVALSNREVDVQLVKPKEVKTDFNDVLKAGGVRAVIDALTDQKKVGEAQISGYFLKEIQTRIKSMERSDLLKNIDDNKTLITPLNEQELMSSIPDPFQHTLNVDSKSAKGLQIQMTNTVENRVENLPNNLINRQQSLPLHVIQDPNRLATLHDCVLTKENELLKDRMAQLLQKPENKPLMSMIAKDPKNEQESNALSNVKGSLKLLGNDNPKQQSLTQNTRDYSQAELSISQKELQKELD